MRKFLLTFFFAFFCLFSSGQNAIERFVARTDTSRLTLDYEFIVYGDTRISGNGTAMIQGNSFRVATEGAFQVYSCGDTRWIVDEVEKEVSIEANGQEIADHPLGLIGDLKASFDIGPLRDGTFRQQAASTSILTPRRELGMKFMQLYFKGNRLIGLVVTLEDDSVTEVAVSHLEFSPKASPDDFRFNVNALDDSWFINDLR